MSTTSLWILNAILALMMFGIALSLKPDDFRRIVKMPRAPLVGLLAQFLLLPLVTYLLTVSIPMPPEVALGMILVGSCPGGSFSNIMTFLARGNAALSVSMTAVSSLAAAFLTPLNFMFYAAMNPDTRVLLQEIQVPAVDVLTVVALVLVIPLVSGLLIGHFYPRFVRRTEKPFRIISLVTLLLFVAVAFSNHWQAFVGDISKFLILVALHNTIALLIGYMSARITGLGKAEQRAITLEVGIQNSGLGLGIIFTFFGHLSGMAVIAGAWGIWHLISGLILSWYWSERSNRSAQSVMAFDQEVGRD